MLIKPGKMRKRPSWKYCADRVSQLTHSAQDMDMVSHTSERGNTRP